MPEEKIPEHQHSSIDVRTITAPMVTLVSLAGFLVWGTTTILDERQALRDLVKTEVSELKNWHEGEMHQIQDILRQMQLAIVEIRERQHFVLENLISKKDFLIWCNEMEKQNQNFKCPSYQTLKEMGLLGTYEKYGINDGDNVLNRRELLDDMRIERESGYGIFNKNDPRHSPDANIYTKPKIKEELVPELPPEKK